MKNRIGLLISVGLILLSIEQTEAKRACYKNLGCFTNTTPFYIFFFRHFTMPASPTEIGTKFFLYTRENRESRTILKPRQESIEDSFFRGERNTVFIIHGYLSYSDVFWIEDMRKALLDVGDHNVIVVDWNKGAFHKFAKAVANTRLVGRQIAYLIRQLKTFGGGSESRVHLIGHSLGAHAAGFAGKNLTNLARITGLDPAGPGFDRNLNKMRLHHTDAKYVDVIHTDAAYDIGISLGIRRRVGDADFYPNGGATQPRCNHGHICSHTVVCLMFTESIRNYPLALQGKPCPSYEDFQQGMCKECAAGCNPMGFFSTKPAKRTTYYLDTQRKDPRYKEIEDPTPGYSWGDVLNFWGRSDSEQDIETTLAPSAIPTSPLFDGRIDSRAYNQIADTQKSQGSFLDKVTSWWEDEDDENEDNITSYIYDFIYFWSSEEINQEATTIAITEGPVSTTTTIVNKVTTEKDGGDGGFFSALWGKEEKTDKNTIGASIKTTRPITATTKAVTSPPFDEQKTDNNIFSNFMGWLYPTRKSKEKTIIVSVVTTLAPKTTTSAQSYWNYFTGIFG